MTDLPKLRIGLQVNTTQRAFRWYEIMELVEVAEAVGLDSIWTEDHLFYEANGRWFGPWDAWTILAGIAVATEHVTLGTLVSPLSMRHPVLLARHAAAVQEMSGGRLVLGIGLGHGEPEYRALGLNLEQRFAKFRESFAILRQSLESGTTDFDGHHFASEQFRLLPQVPDSQSPHLMVGSNGRLTLRETLPYVHGWNWDGFSNRPERFAEASRQVDEICLEIGRDPAEISRSAHVIVRLHDAEGLPIDPIPPEVPLIAGESEEIAASFQRFAEAGADELMMILDPATPSAIERIAEAANLIPRWTMP